MVTNYINPSGPVGTRKNVHNQISPVGIKQMERSDNRKTTRYVITFHTNHSS